MLPSRKSSMQMRLTPRELNQTHKINENNEQLKAQIRDCILRFEPATFACKRPPNVEGSIGFLEDVDEGMGGPDSFRTWMMSVLDSLVRKTVEAEVQQQCKNTRLTPEKMKMVAPAILSKVLETMEMKRCLSQVERSTSEAVSNMLDNFESELVLFQQLRGRANSSKKRDNTLDSLYSSNGSNISFMNSGLFERVSEQLRPYMGSESRMEALNLLMSAQLCDVVASEEWKSIKEGLSFALLDTQTSKMSSLAIKIHARIIGNMSPYCTKEAFVNVVETLLKVYKDKSRFGMLPSQGSEIGLKKRSHFNIFQMFKFVVIVAKDIPKLWIRYPEPYVTEIVKSMLELICIVEIKHVRGPTPHTPLELISLVDPQGLWIQSWLHGKFGRGIFLSDVRSCLILLKANLQVITSQLENFKNTQLLIARGSSRGKGLVSTNMSCFANFSHSLRMATLLMQYKKELTGVNFESVIISWMSYLNSLNHRSTQEINKLLVNSIQKLFIRDHLVSASFKNKMFIKTLSEPLIQFHEDIKLKAKDSASLGKSPNSVNSTEALKNILSVLVQILDLPKGLKIFASLKTELKKGLTISDFLLDLLSKALINFDAVPREVTFKLLECASKLLNDSRVVQSKVMPSLVEAMTEVYGELDYQTSYTPTNICTGQGGSQKEEKDTKLILKNIGAILLKLSIHPGGVICSSESSALDNILRNYSSKFTNHSHTSLAFQNIAFTTKGQIIIMDQRVLHGLLEKLEENPATSEQNSKPAFSFPSPDEIEEYTNFQMQQIFCLVSNPQTAINAESSALLWPIFNLEQSFFAYSMAANDSSVFLQILIALCSSLDFYCYLQQREDFLGQIKKLMFEYQEPFVVPVIDKMSLYFDFLIAFCSSIGGDCEKELPQLDLMPRKKVIEDRTSLTFSDKTPSLSLNLTDSDSLSVNLKIFVEKILVSESGFTKQAFQALLNQMILLNSKSALFMNRNKDDGNVTSCAEKIATNHCAIDLFTKYQPSTTKASLDALSKYNFSSVRDDIHSKFDWFGAIILAVFDDDLSRTQDFLNYFNQCPSAEFVWPKRVGKTSFLKLSHFIEVVMIEEIPEVYYAMKDNGISLATVINRWWSQLFLNYLNWSEICNFLALALTSGPDHIVYFYVGLFNHLRNDILKFTVGSSSRDSDRSLILYLLSNPIMNFKLCRNFDFIKKLRDSYPLKEI